MVVNQSKTQLLCLSASIHDQVSSYLRPLVGGNRAETRSDCSLKILGFNFNTSPTVSFHIQALCGKFWSNLWSLRQLWRSGMKPYNMINIYKTTLRPIIEYTCVTCGPMLTTQQSTSLERLHLRALKIVYGINISYAMVLSNTNIGTLESRRWELIEKFAIKTSKNPRYAARWFPLAKQAGYDLRKPRKYVEEKSRTDRLYRSPIFTMRRILNAPQTW